MDLTMYPCAGCGSLDDHPKVHYGETRYHYDCLPDHVRMDIYGGLDDERISKLNQVIDEAAHLSGQELRDKIVDLHSANVKKGKK